MGTSKERKEIHKLFNNLFYIQSQIQVNYFFLKKSTRAFWLEAKFQRVSLSGTKYIFLLQNNQIIMHKKYILSVTHLSQIFLESIPMVFGLEQTSSGYQGHIVKSFKKYFNIFITFKIQLEITFVSSLQESVAELFGLKRKSNGYH